MPVFWALAEEELDVEGKIGSSKAFWIGALLLERATDAEATELGALPDGRAAEEAEGADGALPEWRAAEGWGSEESDGALPDGRAAEGCEGTGGLEADLARKRCAPCCLLVVKKASKSYSSSSERSEVGSLLREK